MSRLDLLRGVERKIGKVCMGSIGDPRLHSFDHGLGSVHHVHLQLYTWNDIGDTKFKNVYRDTFVPIIVVLVPYSQDSRTADPYQNREKRRFKTRARLTYTDNANRLDV